MFESLLPIAGSLLGGLFQDDAAQTQADATRAAAGTAAEAANPHLQWQKEVAIPYLTKVLSSQEDPSSATNRIRSGTLEALLPLLKELNSNGLPGMFDQNSPEVLSAKRLRDVGMNELTDRSDNPMNFSSYRDREALSRLAMNTMTDPVSFLEGPYARFYDQAGEDAISRNAMAKGQGRSSNLIRDLHKFGGKDSFQNMQQFLSNLMSLSTQRGNQFTTDESSALQAMTAGNSLLSALMDQYSKGAGLTDANVNSRIGTLANLFNLSNTGKQDPYFDKLVSLAGGNPAASAQAIMTGNNTAGAQSLGGTAALTNGLKQALGLLTNEQIKSTPQQAPYPYDDQNPVPVNNNTSMINWDDPATPNLGNVYNNQVRF